MLRGSRGRGGGIRWGMGCVGGVVCVCVSMCR